MATYRHGLRASKLIARRWDQIDLKVSTIQVSRLKHGSSSSHLPCCPELRALRVLKREQLDTVPLYLGHKNISTRCVIRNCRRAGLEITGRIECHWPQTPPTARAAISAGDSFARERAKSLRGCRAGLLLKCGEPLAERIDIGVLLLDRIDLALLRSQLRVLRLE